MEPKSMGSTMPPPLKKKSTSLSSLGGLSMQYLSVVTCSW